MNLQAKKCPEAGAGGLTITITIDSSENATWQGEIHWQESNRSQRFHSEIELLRQIGAAIDAAAPKGKTA